MNDVYEMAFIPTMRRNVLVNEVFTCPDSYSCALIQSAIKERADTAGCSLLADLWYREKGNRPGVDGFEHVLSAIARSGSPSRRQAVQMVSSLPGTSVEDEDRELTALANSCMSRLSNLGFRKVGIRVQAASIEEMRALNSSDEVLQQPGIPSGSD